MGNAMRNFGDGWTLQDEITTSDGTWLPGAEVGTGL